MLSYYFPAIMCAAGILLAILAGALREARRARNARRAPRPPAATKLSRKWARAMFHMGYISIEELCHIYDTTPPDPEDEVTKGNLQEFK